MSSLLTLFFFCFSFTLRVPRTPTTWGPLEGRCRSPTSWPRSFILKPKARTTASTCWPPSKASASAQRHSQGRNTARRPLLHQEGGTLVKSCDPYVITGPINTPPFDCVGEIQGKSRKKIPSRYQGSEVKVHKCCLSVFYNYIKQFFYAHF